MTTVAPAKIGLDALLTPEKSILILIDHQNNKQNLRNTHQTDRGCGLTFVGGQHVCCSAR